MLKRFYIRHSLAKRQFTTVTGMDSESLSKIAMRDRELRSKHMKYCEEYDEQTHKRKLIYRSNQRGWLEVDILLGRWAKSHVMDLSKSELIDYEKVLNLETIEIFYAITKPIDQVPIAIQSPVLEKIRTFALNLPRNS